MMNFHDNLNTNKQGFVLVASMLILLVLSIIGIAAMSNMNIEKMIANNDRRHKETFTAAEAGAVLGVELLEQNLYCAGGFSTTGTDNSTGTVIDIADLEGTIRTYDQGNNLAFYLNPPPTIDANTTITTANVAFPIAPGTNLIRNFQSTYLYIGGATHMAPGGSLQMAAGYEGKGKSAAGGGAYKLYDIYSRHFGLNDSESYVLLGWRHPIDLTDTCKY